MKAKNIVFNGYCPGCELQHINAEMIVNDMDFFECPSCHLQMTVFPEAVAILPWKGDGKFRTNVTKATEGFKGQPIYAASKEPGEEIFPDLEKEISTILALYQYIEQFEEEEAQKKQPIPLDEGVIQKQTLHLESIASEEWENLLQLFNMVEKDGLNSEAFYQFHQMLCDLGIIFDFDWMNSIYVVGLTRNDAFDFSSCSILDLSAYLTVIFRADRFIDNAIKTCFETGVITRIFKCLEQII